MLILKSRLSLFVAAFQKPFLISEVRILVRHFSTISERWAMLYIIDLYIFFENLNFSNNKANVIGGDKKLEG